jgi:hypothetical protein
LVNVLWGLLNLVIAYLLLVRVHKFDLRNWWHVLPFGLGFALMAVQLAWVFGKLHGGA